MNYKLEITILRGFLVVYKKTNESLTCIKTDGKQK